MKILVFGAGANGKACLAYFEKQAAVEVIGYLDNAAQNALMEDSAGRVIPVYHPSEGVRLQYDLIFISNGCLSQVAEIKQQLFALGVPEGKIKTLLEDSQTYTAVLTAYNQYDEQTDSRVIWLRGYAQYATMHNFSGNVAECGVCMGEFSYYINKYFPDKRIYLFDTFEGFPCEDLAAERALNNAAFLTGKFNSQDIFAGASESIALARMLHPEKCVLKKGYFPETADGVDESFCFVNLDMDLYQPMLAGLKFFYEKMCEGGVILLHDYFHPELPGVKQAVEDFEQELGIRLCKVPIGDFCSIAVIKNSER